MSLEILEVTNTKSVGSHYEIKTREWFASHPHYEIVSQNYSIRGGEIDLILIDRSVGKRPELVFVEVRYRDGDSEIQALDSITPQKRRNVLRVARYFLAHESVQAYSIRFDLVAWKGECFSHIRDAWRY